MRFSELEFMKTPLPEGIQAVVSYGNDYELSIIQNSVSYGSKQGLYEIAVFFQGEQQELKGVTEEGDTIKGFLSEQEVDAIMLKMMALTEEEGSQV